MSHKMTAQDWNDEYFKALRRETKLREAAELVLARVNNFNINTPIKDLQDTWDILQAAITQSKEGK